MRRIAFALMTGAIALSALAGTAAAKQPDRSGNTIVDIASSNPNFTILTSLVVDLGLADALSQKGQLTVFAPTDAAFAEILPAVAGCDAATLRDIVLYHVAKGARYSDSVIGSTQIRMLNGDFAPVSIPYVGGAELNLGMLDIKASNGVIHVLNDVMVPADFAGC